MTETRDPALDDLDLEQTANGDGNGSRWIENEPPDVEPARSEHRTDSGNARRLVALHGDKIRHVGAWGQWLTWDGRRWQRDTKSTVNELAKDVARQILREATNHDGDKRRDLIKWGLQSENASKIEAMVRMARSDPRVAIDPQQLDADPYLLNVGNGTINLRTGTRHAHNQRDLITKIAAVDHNVTATAPQWLQFLDTVLPDPEVRTFLQRYIGSCCTGDVSEHKLVFAFGIGANGKSTLLNAVAHILGDYAGQAAPDLLMRRRDEPHPTGLADLQGRRLVLATETAQNRHLDEALVKRLTGGDRIKARHMYADFFEFEPTHKFIVATNHRPEVEGTDHGIWRRIRLVPFDVVIDDADQDRDLEQKLVAEAPGILNWAIAGCEEWQSKGLTEPAAITNATAEYRAAMDVIGDFISDCCVLAGGVHAKAADLFKTYGQWCESMGETAVSQRAFGLKLRERGLTKTTSGVVWWDGIALKAVGRDGEEEGAGPWDPNARRESAAQRLDF